MIIIIDGYNLLKNRDNGDYIEESTREKFIRILGAYHKRRGHLIMLIFDGGSSPWPFQVTKAGIKVIYAGAGKSADDFIKNYISEHHKEDLFLVSSDRELGLWASKYDIASINSPSFYDIIINTHVYAPKNKLKPGAAIKTTAKEDSFLDSLMQQASSCVVSKEEDRRQECEKRARGKKESKVDRILKKKIEKL